MMNHHLSKETQEHDLSVSPPQVLCSAQGRHQQLEVEHARSHSTIAVDWLHLKKMAEKWRRNHTKANNWPLGYELCLIIWLRMKYEASWIRTQCILHFTWPCEEEGKESTIHGVYDSLLFCCFPPRGIASNCCFRFLGSFQNDGSGLLRSTV